MPSAHRPLDWTAQQQVRIDAARITMNTAQDREIMQRVQEPSLMLRMHMWQTLIMQQNDRVNRLYAGHALYCLWRHMLIGSTLDAAHTTDDAYEDFPGDDAVEAFIHRLNTQFAEVIRLIDEKLADIRARYPDYRTHAWYGKITGDIRQTPNSDFPGDDSLEKFLRDTLARIVPRTPTGQP